MDLQPVLCGDLQVLPEYALFPEPLLLYWLVPFANLGVYKFNPVCVTIRL
ncbi:hypothetical protein MalM14_26170 [Gimesia chilikensis]|nr:hypothetical protein MalM14_26170 [Gimesia chilikensis]